MAAKKLKREYYSLPAKINNSERIKKIDSKRKKTSGNIFFKSNV